MSIATQTPAQIDATRAEVFGKTATAKARRSMVLDNMHRMAEPSVRFGRAWTKTDAEAIAAVETMATRTDHTARPAERALESLRQFDADLAALAAEAAPLNAEFERRGGWTRAFLVTNGNGHVHSTMNCSTCNRGRRATEFQWMTDFSAMDEAEIVAAAGWRACTVCYPTAPVGDATSLPTRMFSDADKAKEAAKAEREAAKAARDAARIAKGLTEDGSEFEVTYVESDAPGWERNDQGQQVHVYRDRERTERFKTETAAVQWMLEARAWGAYGHGKPAKDKAPAFDQIIAAMARKHGKTVAEVTAEVEAKVAAKIKRDNR